MIPDGRVTILDEMTRATGRATITDRGRDDGFAWPAKVIDHVPAEPIPSGKWAGRDRTAGQVGTELPPLADLACIAHGVDLAQEEGDEPQPGQPPGRLGHEQHDMRDEGGGEPARRQVRPEDQLGVAGDPPLERGAGVVVGRRDLVEDPAAWGEDAAIAGPAEAEAEVDVLVVRAEKRIEAADPPEGLGPVERARAAGGEDVFERTVGSSGSAGWPWPRLVGQPARV